MIARPPFRDAFRFWVKLGFISFGGPAGQIAIMHTELVERKKWISEERFLHALNYCMFLPGPEAQQLATYVGWLLHGMIGGIVAGLFFVIPSFFILTALSWVYVTHGAVPAVAAIFGGLRVAVLAIVVSAMIRIGRKSLKNGASFALAALAFAGLYFWHVPFPIVILSAAAIGLLGNRFRAHRSPTDSSPEPGPLDGHTRPRLSHSILVLLIGLTMWIGALFFLSAVWGNSSVFYQMGRFFSKAAMVTFGGAYAVLPYIAQAGVEHYHWLLPGQMIDGLGLAETTPGPLIMLVTFVGFVGAWSNAAAVALSPAMAGVLGAVVATYVTFLPCFLWIFLGAPYIEQTRGNVPLSSALGSITAAVVGVMLNLAVFFGAHVLVPEPGTFAWPAFLLAAVAFIGLWKFGWDIVYVILVSAGIGLACRQLGVPLG